MMGFLRTRTERAHGWICRRSRGHIFENVFSQFHTTIGTAIVSLRTIRCNPESLADHESNRQVQFLQRRTSTMFLALMRNHSYVTFNRMIKRLFTLDNDCFCRSLFITISIFSVLIIVLNNFIFFTFINK